jgi:hypothetical protein
MTSSAEAVWRLLLDERLSPQDRELVQALMLRGWYRDGQEPPDDTGRSVWRFRSGHSLEDPQRKTILIRARSQRAAMQALLDRLRQENGNGSVPVSSAS